MTAHGTRLPPCEDAHPRRGELNGGPLKFPAAANVSLRMRAHPSAVQPRAVLTWVACATWIGVSARTILFSGTLLLTHTSLRGCTSGTVFHRQTCRVGERSRRIPSRPSVTGRRYRCRRSGFFNSVYNRTFRRDRRPSYLKRRASRHRGESSNQSQHFEKLLRT